MGRIASIPIIRDCLMIKVRMSVKAKESVQEDKRISRKVLEVQEAGISP